MRQIPIPEDVRRQMIRCDNKITFYEQEISRIEDSITQIDNYNVLIAEAEKDKDDTIFELIRKSVENGENIDDYVIFDGRVLVNREDTSIVRMKEDEIEE